MWWPFWRKSSNALGKEFQAREAENAHLKTEAETYAKDLESLIRARTDQLQTATGNLERSFDVSLEASGYALDLKQNSPKGHSRRVTLFTIALAQAMGLPREQIALIARGSFLHDIGKMAVPDAILAKPDKLTPEERAVMQEHPFRGYQMIRNISSLKAPAEIVYSHHERLDGTGYPRQLKGGNIPFGARIVAIANTLDSITSNLPYRPARSLGAARQEIEMGSGRQFDPEIVNVFLSMPDKIWDDLRRSVDAP